MKDSRRTNKNGFLSPWLWILCGLILVLTYAQKISISPLPAGNKNWLTVTSFSANDSATRDVEEALQANREAICQQLQVKCSFPVHVELYPSQSSFDEHVMNPAFRGYYAISGEGKIQMVSPNVPPAGREIPYEERVKIAVHEYVHLTLDQVDQELPAWLDEGTAVLLGPHDIYNQVCQYAFPFEMLPPLDTLIQSYASVPAADLYAYTLVSFIIERDGMDTLYTLLRDPKKRDAYIQQFPGGLETEWSAYLKRTCVPATAAAQTQQLVDSEISPAFLPQTCWFAIPKEAQVTCGTVAVPEDRQRAMTPSNTIHLAVAVFHATTTTPAPDPVIYHVGGPGGHLLIAVPRLYERVFAPYLKARDLILFDPRGTGYSQPALKCAEGEDPGACVRRLFAEGRNLYAYNSSSMAADVQDIRRALSYEQWNFIGESYGTHVAQIVMRERPEGLRSVILDAVVPVVSPPLPEGKGAFELSLGRLFARCQADPACSTAYPDLPQSLEQAIQQLNSNPVQLRVTIDTETHSITLTGDQLKQYVMTD